MEDSCTRVTSNEDGLNSEDSCLKRERSIKNGVKDLCLQGVRTSKVLISQEVKSWLWWRNIDGG